MGFSVFVVVQRCWLFVAAAAAAVVVVVVTCVYHACPCVCLCVMVLISSADDFLFPDLTEKSCIWFTYVHHSHIRKELRFEEAQPVL